MSKAKSIKLFRCAECGLSYEKRELSKQCKSWCSKYKSCNLQITKYAKNKK